MLIQDGLNLIYLIYGSSVTSTLHIHLIFNERTGSPICTLNVQGFPCHPLPVILAIQKIVFFCCMMLQPDISYVILIYYKHIIWFGIFTENSLLLYCKIKGIVFSQRQIVYAHFFWAVKENNMEACICHVIKVIVTFFFLSFYLTF